LAERVMALSNDVEDRLVLSYRLLTSRSPSDKELNLLKGLFDQALDSFQSKPEKANTYVTVGESVPDSSLDKNTLAAHAVVASVVMNHDAAVVIR
jgi:hypothetical protein